MSGTRTVLTNSSRFFYKDLKIMNGRMIKFDRIHRLGRYSPIKTRPIIAKFCYYPDREMVRKATKNLDGTQYSINQQFPKEINAKRKALVPTLKSLKDEGQRPTFPSISCMSTGGCIRANW